MMIKINSNTAKHNQYFGLDLQELPIYSVASQTLDSDVICLTENSAYTLAEACYGAVYVNSDIEFGVLHVLRMCETLARLRDQHISWKNQYPVAEDVTRESIGHCAELTTTSDNKLYGVIACIMFLNRKLINMGLHFGLEYDHDSNWIKVYLSWG